MKAQTQLLLIEVLASALAWLVAGALGWQAIEMYQDGHNFYAALLGVGAMSMTSERGES